MTGRERYLAMLRGEDFRSLPAHQILGDLDQLQADFLAFEFPR